MSMSEPISLDLPLAKIALDRDYLSRIRPNLFEELWANPATKVLQMWQGKVLLNQDGSLKFLPPSEVKSTDLLVYLGKVLGSMEPVVLAVLPESPFDSTVNKEEDWHHLRKSGLGLTSVEAAIFTQALALANWHATHRFCSNCSSATESIKGGWVLRCVDEGREIYPRTDPAIIVGVVDDQDRILLGSQGIWEENRFSILAGFVEPGESLDAAVIREMAEEAGIRVKNPRFLGSQAWPFPFSLMVGYLAEYDGGLLTPDGEEIVKLRWFSRAELKAEVGDLLLPGELSIARVIIEHWLGEKLGV
jgi:NAD+ diphosphatase